MIPAATVQLFGQVHGGIMNVIIPILTEYNLTKLDVEIETESTGGIGIIVAIQ